MTECGTRNTLTTGRILWVGATVDIGIASARYRMIHPAAMLKKMGWVCDITDKPDQYLTKLASYTAIVIVKRLDPTMIRLVSAANDCGVPVLLDLCDDVLDQDYRASQHEMFRMVFETISPRLAGLVTTGTILKRRFTDYGYKGPVSIIPDCVETTGLLEMSTRFVSGASKDATLNEKEFLEPRIDRLSDFKRRTRRLASAIRHPRRSALNLRSTLHTIWYGPPLDRALSKSAALSDPDFIAAFKERQRTLVWFGNHGGPHSDFGMATLLSIARELREAYERSPFTLVVVSNHKEKWTHLIEPIGIPARYVAWSQSGTQELLSRARAFIMPTGSDSFSLSKSANRVTLALQQNTPVISEHLESLDWMDDGIFKPQELADAIVHCLEDRTAAVATSQNLRATANEKFNIEQIAQQWADTLQTARPYEKQRGNYGKTTLPEKLLVLINNATDRPLGMAMVDACRARGIETGVIVTAESCARNPQLIEDLIERRISPTFLQRSDTRRQDFRWLRNSSALFCPSESNLPAHAIPHWLTRMANAAGLRTYTAQHGLANVGLTDSQAKYVTFASETIFTWNDPALLPEWVEPSVRARCIMTGRIAPAPEDPVLTADIRSGPPRKIGIYENLHWSAYTPEYRNAFVAMVRGLAEAHPEATFSIIPHPAGLWSVKFIKVDSVPENVEIRSPAKRETFRQTGIGALREFDRILTTPSSIAIDAALAGVPTAIYAPERFDLSLYSGLQSADTPAGAEDVLFGQPAEKLTEGARTFLDQAMTRESDPVGRALDVMFGTSLKTAGTVRSIA